jgi:hypothetical protein
MILSEFEQINEFKKSGSGHEWSETSLKTLLDLQGLDQERVSSIRARFNENPYLSQLYDNDLILLSTKNNEKNRVATQTEEWQSLKFGSQKRHGEALEQSLDQNTDILDIVEKSLDEIEKSLSKVTKLGVDFLTTELNSVRDTSFRGLVMETSPDIEGTSRQESYDFSEKTIRICFANQMFAPAKIDVLLVHEFAHALDDVRQLDSSQAVLRSIKTESDDQFDELIDTSQSIATLNRTSQPNPSMASFQGYGDFTHEISGIYEATTKSERVASWLQDYNSDFSRGAPSTFPSEFLGFAIESAFSVLKESNDAQEFEEKYTQKLAKVVDYALKGESELPNRKSMVSQALDLVQNALQGCVNSSAQNPEINSELRGSMSCVHNVFSDVKEYTMQWSEDLGRSKKKADNAISGIIKRPRVDSQVGGSGSTESKVEEKSETKQEERSDEEEKSNITTGTVVASRRGFWQDKIRQERSWFKDGNCNIM